MNDSPVSHPGSKDNGSGSGLTVVMIVVSNVDKAIGFEWLVQRLDKTRFDLRFLLLNEGESQLGNFLRAEEIKVHEVHFGGRPTIPLALLKVLRIFLAEGPDVIHTHLFGANVIGLTAGWLARIRKRIYTRHSANENRRYHGKQWIDRVVNRLATDVIAISENVKNILMREEAVPAEKITLLHHGFELKEFSNVPLERTQALKAKYDPEDRSPVIGVIARYSHWKGIQYVISAFKKLLQDFPGAFLVLANAGKGDYKDEIGEMLMGLPDGSFTEIVFEKDLFSLYKLFDVYVHTPIDPELEAFGQTYVEALASGIPSVFTLSGVAPEFIEHERNALVVDFQDSEQTHHAVKRLLDDEELRERLIANGREDVREMFSIELMIDRLSRLYSS